ncbi:hypothetical protein L6452_33056 [Arctium lappa]|uniref:Uncharacterized protein n=1 Tax=Arctium lappa TaxID=4217 RepID=A0ACB8Z7E9_ARCLA|nr:hypothetical protein L6452_33056 [Arctium lappa]
MEDEASAAASAASVLADDDEIEILQIRFVGDRSSTVEEDGGATVATAGDSGVRYEENSTGELIVSQFSEWGIEDHELWISLTRSIISIQKGITSQVRVEQELIAQVERGANVKENTKSILM